MIARRAFLLGSSALAGAAISSSLAIARKALPLPIGEPTTHVLSWYEKVSGEPLVSAGNWVRRQRLLTAAEAKTVIDMDPWQRAKTFFGPGDCYLAQLEEARPLPWSPYEPQVTNFFALSDQPVQVDKNLVVRKNDGECSGSIEAR